MKIIELKDSLIRNDLKHSLGIRKWDSWLLAGFGLYEEDDLCGWIVASIDKKSKSADIEAFWIKEEFRGNGYGESLFAGMIDLLKKANIKAVMVSLLLPEDAHAAGFFIRKGFYDCEEEYPVFHLTATGLKAFVEEERKRQEMSKGRILRTKEGPSEEAWMEGRSAVTIMALEELSDRERVAVMEGPAKVFLGFGQMAVDPHFSLAVFRDNKVTAVILIRRRIEKPAIFHRDASPVQGQRNTWEIAWMGSTGSAVMSDVMHLVWTTMSRLADELPENDRIFAAAVANSTANLIEKFFARGKWKNELTISHAMRYVRIYEYDNVLSYYLNGTGI